MTCVLLWKLPAISAPAVRLERCFASMRGETLGPGPQQNLHLSPKKAQCPCCSRTPILAWDARVLLSRRRLAP